MVSDIILEGKIEELNKLDKQFVKGYEYAIEYLNDIIRANSDIVEVPEMDEDSITNKLIREFYNFTINEIINFMVSEEHDLINGMLDKYPIEE